MTFDEHIPLDTWKYILYSTELLMNMTSFPMSLALFYYIHRTKTFHLNFRNILCQLNMVYIIASVYRMGDVVAMFIENKSNNSFIERQFYLVFIFYIRFAKTAWQALMCDRIVAGYWPKIYQKTFSTWRCSLLLAGGLIFMSVIGTIVGEIFKNVSELLLLMPHAFGFIIEAFGTYVIQRHLKQQYDSRHNKMISLAKKFYIKQNMLASNYILDVSVAEVITNFVYLGICTYLKSDHAPGKSNGGQIEGWKHVVELLFAVHRLFFDSSLLWKNDKFRRSWNMGQGKKVEDSVTTVSTVYFQFQSKQWE